MTAKELDARIDKWCKRECVPPSCMCLAYTAIKYGYRLAKDEFKKSPSLEELGKMVAEIHKAVVSRPDMCYNPDRDESEECDN